MKTEQQMADAIKAKADELNAAINEMWAEHVVKIEATVTHTRQMRDKFEKPYIHIIVLKPLAGP